LSKYLTTYYFTFLIENLSTKLSVLPKLHLSIPANLTCPTNSSFFYKKLDLVLQDIRFLTNPVKAMHLQSNDNLINGKVIEINKNFIDFSAHKEYYTTLKTRGFSIKHVVEGIEKYTLNGGKYHVSTGNYLLSNETSEGFAEVESATLVKGICITINPELLSEMVASHCSPNTAFPDKTFGDFFSSAHFLENQYAARDTQLGQLLLAIGNGMQKNQLSSADLNIELFYALSEKIIADHTPIFKQLHTIPSIKSSTKKDLFRRISKGKDCIDASFLEPLTIESIAKEACMSEYHFFRLFKSAFGVSPHQYILKKRLERGHAVLLQDKDSVSTAAFESGFSDIHAFSKAFKKHYGFAPSTLLK
jgi:AraC family transcriptional regulator